MRSMVVIAAILSLASAGLGQEQENATVVLPKGTGLTVRLTSALDSGRSKAGDRVIMESVDDVRVNGALVIRKGAEVAGHVETAKKAGFAGRGGKIGIAVEWVRTVDGGKAKIAVAQVEKGQGGYGAGSYTGVALTTVAFFPAAPLWLFKKGHSAVLPYGMIFHVQTSEEARVTTGEEIAQPQAQQAAQSTPARNSNSGGVIGSTIIAPGGKNKSKSLAEMAAEAKKKQ